jgi:hypothetical protein
MIHILKMPLLYCLFLIDLYGSITNTSNIYALTYLEIYPKSDIIEVSLAEERPSHLLHPEQQEHQTSVLVPVVEPDVRSQLPAQQDENVPDDLVADVLLGAQDARCE